MSINKETLKTRTITAAVFVIIMLAGLFVNKTLFVILFWIIGTGVLYEWSLLSSKISGSYNRSIPVITAAMGALIYGFVAYFYLVVSTNPFNDMSTAGMDAMFKILLYFSMIFAGLSFFLILISGDFKRLFLLSKNITGILFISTAYAILIPLYDWYIPVIILFSIWTNDTMAYLIGSMIGKRKLAPNISPNKTIEGTLAGICITVVLAWLISYFFHGAPGYLLSPKEIIFISLISAVMGTIGDLIQSQLKRWAQVKDSGSLMPGHGGLYDRFDSFTFAIPWVAAYLYFFYY